MKKDHTRNDADIIRSIPRPSQTGTQRLNKVISTAGLASRRTADGWIRDGRVSVNGRTVTDLGTTVDPGKDRVTVDGREIPSAPSLIHIMLNKPFGYICSLKDPEGRPVVTDLLPNIHVRVYPVGRLDFDTLGLLLLTNDGPLAQRLTHPGYQVPRTYKATVSGYLTDEAMFALRNGIDLEDGPSGPSRVMIVSRTNRQSTVRITIKQGRSRQIRRMLEGVGYLVIHLMRTGFGPLNLEDLKLGQYRRLNGEEVSSLYLTVGLA